MTVRRFLVKAEIDGKHGSLHLWEKVMDASEVVDSIIAGWRIIKIFEVKS